MSSAAVSARPDAADGIEPELAPGVPLPRRVRLKDSGSYWANALSFLAAGLWFVWFGARGLWQEARTPGGQSVTLFGEELISAHAILWWHWLALVTFGGAILLYARHDFLVRPAKKRWLVAYGHAAHAVVTDVRKETKTVYKSSKGRLKEREVKTYIVTYRFCPDGVPAAYPLTGKVELSSRYEVEQMPSSAGVTVLYRPEDPSDHVLYPLCEYRVLTASGRRQGGR